MTVLNNLDTIDQKFRGLNSRDFEVTRSGEGLDTVYQIMPADVDGGPQPMSDADLKLAGTAPDLKEFTTPPNRETLVNMLSGIDPGTTQSSGGGGNTAASVAANNPFMRK